MKRAALFVGIGAWAAFACGPNEGLGKDGGSDAGGDSPSQQEAGPPNPNGGNLPDGYPNVDVPAVGATSMHVVSPTVLELEKITDQAVWDYASATPDPSSFVVKVDGNVAAVTQVGFKRRPLYAPIAHYDLRVQNDLYLVLAAPIGDGAKVTVDFSSTTFSASADPARFSAAIHVNQVGYAPS